MVILHNVLLKSSLLMKVISLAFRNPIHFIN